jgi:hypothetical protein
MLLGGTVLTVGAVSYQLGISAIDKRCLGLSLLLMLSGGMVLVIDFNRPRRGLTRIDATPLIWTLHGMTPAPQK